MLQLVFYNAGGNINAIARKNVLSGFMSMNKPTIFSVTEANINHLENVPKLCFEEYNLIDSNKKRIVTYFRRDSGFRVVDHGVDLGLPIHILEGRDVVVAGVYSEFKRYSPDQTTFEPVDRPERLKLLKNAIKFVAGIAGNRSVIVGGDVNFDFKQQANEEVKEYVRFLKLMGLEQQVKEITRPKKGRSLESGTIIDHVLVKNFKGQAYALAMGESDHRAVVFSNGGYTRIRSRPFTTITKVKYNVDVWRWAYEFYPFGRPDQKWDDLEMIVDELESYMSAVQALATKQYKAKEGVPWWTPELTKLHVAANKAPKTLQKDRALKAGVKKAIREWDNRQMQKKGHPHRMKERTQINKLKKGGVEITDKSEIAIELANFFDKKVQDIVEMAEPDFDHLMKGYEDYNKGRGLQEWEMRPPTLQEVKDLIDSLPKKTSSGKDGLPYTLCKYLRDLVAEPIWRIFQLVFKERRFLTRHKLVQITGVYKKGCPESPENYRPVGIGYLVMRLIEKWIAKELASNCLKQPLLPPEVHGFVKGKSCETCLNSVHRFAMEEKAKGMTVAMVFLDATAAFDTIPRSLLLAGMKAIRCGPRTLELMEDYLMNGEWYMQVKVQDKMSHKFVARAGVVQGGGCSASLYAVATSVLEYLTRGVGKIFLYADDSVLVISCPSTCKMAMSMMIRRSIDRMLEVMIALGLKNNEKKSEILPLWESIIDEKFLINGFGCKPSTCLKFLGCMLNKHMDQKDHVKEIIRKMQYAHFKVRTQKYNRNSKQVIQFIKAHIMSHIMYAMNYWLPKSNMADREKLQSAKNRLIIPLMDNRSYSEKAKKKPNYSKLFGKARIESMELMYEKMEIKMAMDLAKEAENVEYMHGGYTKSRMILPLVKGQTEQNRKRKIWNSFPLHAIHFWSKKPKVKLKLYLKKLVNIILDYEAKAGRLPRPASNKTLNNTEIPVLWRLNVIGQLDNAVHEKLTKMHDLQYKGRRFKLNNKKDYLLNFPDPITKQERRAQSRGSVL